VKEAYARGRKAYQIVQDHNSPECFHQWRKRAKDLWYQLTLLGPIWPRQLDAMNRELEGLTERLGEYHDLTVLQRTIEKLAHRNGDADEVQILKRLIEEREREARVMARSLGARFYAEKPSAFCGRLARRWEIWRARKQSTIPSLQKAA
jgi:CHAD domain-containing protein